MVMPSVSSVRHHGPRVARIAGMTLGLFGSIVAQCTPVWQSGEPVAAPDGFVAASVVWDPDGAGPAPSALVVGGRFAVAELLTTPLAMHDGAHWAAIGVLPGDSVTALAVWNGQLVAAIDLTTGTQQVVRWSGSVWQSLGTIHGQVLAMTVYGGELVVTGQFTSIDQVPYSSIARFDGTSWGWLRSPSLTEGLVGGGSALAVYSNLLYVGGAFSAAGSTTARNLASWNATSGWAPAGDPNAGVRALAVRSTSSVATSFLFAGGSFTSIGGVAVQHVARFNTASNAWDALGAGIPAPECRALFVRNTGLSGYEVLAGAHLAGSGTRVWRYSAAAWAPMGFVGTSFVESSPSSFAYVNGSYVVGMGGSTTAVRVFDGAEWQPLVGDGLDGRVDAVLESGSQLLIGGTFRAANGVVLNGIARRSGAGWAALGGGVTGGSGVRALARLPNGQVIAGGVFSSAGGVAANNIARWTGSSWVALGAGCDGPVDALLVAANGDVIAGGEFLTAGGVPAAHIARWNGTAWSPLASGTDGAVYALTQHWTGQLVAGGAFAHADGQLVRSIAAWNGVTWAPLGAGFDGAVFALAAAGYDLVAGGDFRVSGSLTVGAVAWWDGWVWRGFGDPSAPLQGTIRALAVYPTFGLLAGGDPFDAEPIGNTTTTNLAWSSGGPWESLDVHGLAVRAITSRENGDVVAGGAFVRAASVAAGNVAMRIPPCRASATSYGAGCSGGGATLALVATRRPWLGQAVSLRAEGLAAGAVAVMCIGLTNPAFPLVLVHPSASGCTLLVDPLLTYGLSITNGVAEFAFVVPRDPALVGGVMLEQVLQAQFDASQRLVGLKSSNGVALTLGTM